MSAKLLFLPALALCLSTTFTVNAQTIGSPKVNNLTVSGAIACDTATVSCLPQDYRTNLYGWGPFGGSLVNTISASQWVLGGSGRTFAGAVELEDDYTMVRFRFASGGTNSWTVTQAVAASTSSYGPTPSTTAGILPYDVAQNALTSFLPITFTGSGSCTASPWPGANSAYVGTNSGNYVLSLPASTSSTGQPVINFATTVSSAMTGNQAPVAGMYASDGLGHITPGTKVSSVGAFAVTLNANLAGGVTANQQIYFTWTQPTLTMTVPASTNPPEIQEICSDWVPIPSFPRTDGGFAAGMTVSGTNVAGTVTAVGPTSVTLDTPVSGTVAADATITFSTTKATAGAVSGAYVIPVGNTAMLQVGQTVTGTGIPANDWISEVGSGYVRLNSPATGAVSGTLTFSSVAHTNAATTSGNALSFTSTNNKRLILIRAAATSGSTVSGYGASSTAGNLREQAVGLPFWTFYLGGVGVDNINAIAGTGFAKFLQTPVSGIDYIGSHRGVQVVEAGDSITQGTSSANNAANYVRLAAASLSTLTRPISVRNAAFGGQTSNVFLPEMNALITSNKPNLIVVNGYSANGSFAPVEELAKTNGTIAAALATGARAIVTTATSRQVAEMGQYYTTGATTASTTLTLNGGMAFPTAAAYTISGSGIPAGTTANATLDQPVVTLSQPATVADGTLVTFGEPVVSGAISNSTTAVFSHVLPYPSGSYTITGTGFTAGATITVTQGSATATLSPAQTVADGTVATIGSTFSQTKMQQAQGLLLSQGTGAVTVFDGYSCLEDPANPTFYAPAMSADGTHPDDYGHNKEAFACPSGKPSFLSVLRQVIGH